MEDRDLVQSVVDRNATPADRQAAFRILVEKYQDRVFNTCLSLVHDRGDAEDATQEVFVEVYNSLPSFRGDAQLSTWIYRIAVTKSLDHLRWKKRKKRFGFVHSLFGVEGGGSDIADEFHHPGVQLEDKERAAILFKHIDKLPEKQRIALVLYTFEGLSYKEIGGVLGTSVSSVESTIYRARGTLKKRLYVFYKKNL